MTANNKLSKKANDDILLIEDAKKGNEKAFATIMNRYRNSIYYSLFKMINNESDAEDLTMETFSKAFKHIHNYTNNYAFSTWLHKIAKNTCIDFIRKRQTSLSNDNSQESIDYTTNSIQSELLNPEESLINNQKLLNLQYVINQLKPRYRSLIDLRYYKEYSYEEIASELNIPIGTVKAQLYRAKTLLYNLLIKQNP